MIGGATGRCTLISLPPGAVTEIVSPPDLLSGRNEMMVPSSSRSRGNGALDGVPGPRRRPEMFGVPTFDLREAQHPHVHGRHLHHYGRLCQHGESLGRLLFALQVAAGRIAGLSSGAPHTSSKYLSGSCSDRLTCGHCGSSRLPTGQIGHKGGASS
jgi:hypothetical protein